ncbi:phage tail protein [Anaerovibrio lipolyticus]|uniref:phage tail protein n=1 Tax=Anaerovibrio lipolyticus TaxID=82374 RepID=UPI0023A983D7|nr:phage tail protein [Anaerovibrio lipolyticus]
MTDVFTSEQEKGCYLYCDGSSFSTIAYPKLYAVLGTNVLPDLRSRFLEGSDIGNQVIEAGLPNIKAGYFLNYYSGTLSYFGGLYCAGASSSSGVPDYPTHYIIHYDILDFSRSNPIYGRSNTVQPPSVTVRYYIRAR